MRQPDFPHVSRFSRVTIVIRGRHLLQHHHSVSRLGRTGSVGEGLIVSIPSIIFAFARRVVDVPPHLFGTHNRIFLVMQTAGWYS